MEKVPHFMKTNKTMSICVYTCTIYTYMHHQVPPKYDIPSWPSLCTLWMTRSKWEICVESAVFVVFLVLFSAFHVFMKSAPLFIQKVPLFMKTNKTMSICVYTCTIYTYMHHIHHQIPPKYKIYLVGLPSVLYKTPGQNKRSILNQLFLLIFSAFHRKCWFHTKSATFHENQQNHVNMYVYMYHLYIHAPPHTN